MVTKLVWGHTRVVDGVKQEVYVPVSRFIGWDIKNKYTAAKLKEIRKEQVKKALVNHKGKFWKPDEFLDGTPIKANYI